MPMRPTKVYPILGPYPDAVAYLLAQAREDPWTLVDYYSNDTYWDRHLFVEGRDAWSIFEKAGRIPKDRW